MPSEHSSDVKFEIGHVLFIDIVGYSKLLINEQSEQIQKLKQIVRSTEQFRLAQAEGKLLRLPTGDGGALVFRNSLEAPALCSMEIAKALNDYPKLLVRMGIHSGPVNEITDLNEQANIAGAGINIAKRVMDCGDAGHILLSKHVAEDLPEIAKQLGVAHILEGSVQKANDAVRVNVQLIKAANDSHLWADTYDRRLTDIFSVESEVAKAIADQLRAKLTGPEEQIIAAKPTDNPEAYDAYLRGRAFAAGSQFDKSTVEGA